MVRHLKRKTCSLDYKRIVYSTSKNIITSIITINTFITMNSFITMNTRHSLPKLCLKVKASCEQDKNKL